MSTGERHPFDEVRACGDTTIAEMLDPEEKIGNILIPDMAQKAPVYWLVISVGPKVTEVQKGDRILFASGARVQHEGRTIVALKPHEILGTLPVPKEPSRVFDPTKY